MEGRNPEWPRSKGWPGRAVLPIVMGVIRSDDFDAEHLDTTAWVPHYLPAWTSRAETAAVHTVADSLLTLRIPRDQGLWCPDDHESPLRVSGIMSGHHSGPVGSTTSQQALFEGQLVREEQPTHRGWLLSPGTVEVRCSMTISPRSMAAVWLCGWEEVPEQSGEICVVEIFGTSIQGASCEVGMGLKSIRDPELVGDFDAPRLSVDPAEMHTYAATWDEHGAVFSVDGEEVRRCAGPPTYDLQLMVAVFDFPDESDGSDEDLEPELVIDRIRSS